MTDTQEKTTEGEVVDQKVKTGQASQPTDSPKVNESLTIFNYQPNMKVTREKIEKHIDDKEKETGVFHWMNKDGSYTPVTDMSKEQLETAASHSEKRMAKLQEFIEVLHDQMCGWQRRIEKIEEEAENREITLELEESVKEPTEIIEQ